MEDYDVDLLMQENDELKIEKTNLEISLEEANDEIERLTSILEEVETVLNRI